MGSCSLLFGEDYLSRKRVYLILAKLKILQHLSSILGGMNTFQCVPSIA